MKKSFYLILLLFLGIICSCNNNEVKDAQKPKTGPNGELAFHVTTDMAQKNIRLSDFVEDIQFIPLETKEECFLSNFPNVIAFYKGNVYYQEMYGGYLYRFDTAGKFLNRIGDRGEGPGEYGDPSDLYIDYKNDQIGLVSWNGTNIYDLEGNYISKRKKTNSASKIRLFSDSLYACTGFGSHYMMLENSRGELINQALPFNEQFSLLSRCPLSLLNNQTVLYRHNFYDTVYAFQGVSIKPYRIFNFGDERFTMEDYKAANIDQLAWYEYQMEHQISKLSDYFENENVAVAKIFNNDRYFTYIYQKESEKQLLVNNKDVINDVFFDGFYFEFHGRYEEYLVSKLLAEEVIKGVENANDIFSDEELQNNKYYQKLSKLASQLNEEDNPVLMLVKFKAKS